MLFVVLLSTMMSPSILTLIPTCILFARLGLVHTCWPWVLWGLAASPYLVVLFRQFFDAIPAELEDAAIIDGCTYGQVFARIFLPLSLPALLTSFALSFTWTWGDYIAPALFLDINHTTVPSRSPPGTATRMATLAPPPKPPQRPCTSFPCWRSSCSPSATSSAASSCRA